MKMKTWIAAIWFTALLTSAVAGAGERLNIDSFDHPDNKTELGGWWYVYDDARVGGNSTVSPAVDHFTPAKSSDGQGYAAHLQGKCGNKLGWDFFGMGFTIMSDSGCPVSSPIDLSGYGTLEFKIKGEVSAGRLSVVIPYTDNSCENNVPETLTAWADYQVGITANISDTWTTVRLDLRKDFSQPTWTKPEHAVSIEQVLSHAHVIQWHFSSADGDTVDVWIDDIAIY
jgi:hypothetical protein